MGREGVGELERLVLLAVLGLEGEAYGARILEVLEERAGRTLTAGTIYVALRRLEEKRLVSSELGEPTPRRGGRPKRYYRVEAPGLEALRTARDEWEAMLHGVEDLLEAEG